MLALIVLILILALNVITYNISSKQKENEFLNRLENTNETMIQDWMNDDLNYLRLFAKDF